MKNVIQAKAKEKQEANLKQNITVSQKSDERYIKNPMRTDEELSKLAGVSRDTICSLVRNLTKQQGGQGGILLLQKSEKANRKDRLVRNLTNRLEKSIPSVRNLLPQNRLCRNLTRRFLSQGKRESSNVYWGD